MIWLFIRGYIQSIFKDFESYLGTKVGLVDGEVELISKQYKSNFITYELSQRIYLNRDNNDYFDEILIGSIQVEYDDFSMENKLLEKSIATIIMFDDRSFFGTLLCFLPYWDYKAKNESVIYKITN